jgi:hypothetical protein
MLDYADDRDEKEEEVSKESIARANTSSLSLVGSSCQDNKRRNSVPQHLLCCSPHPSLTIVRFIVRSSSARLELTLNRCRLSPSLSSSCSSARISLTCRIHSYRLLRLHHCLLRATHSPVSLFEACSEAPEHCHTWPTSLVRTLIMQIRFFFFFFFFIPTISSPSTSFTSLTLNTFNRRSCRSTSDNWVWTQLPFSRDARPLSYHCDLCPVSRYFGLHVPNIHALNHDCKHPSFPFSLFLPPPPIRLD